MMKRITITKVLFLVTVLFLSSLNAKAESCSTAPVDKTWISLPFTGDASYTGTYVVMWKFRTNYAPIDFVFGAGVSATAYGGLACITRFNTTSVVDCHNGTGYGSDVVYNYQPNTDYYLKMVINVTAQTFSSYVKTAGQAWTQIANNYGFREKVATTHSNVTYRSNTATPSTMTLEELKQEVCDVWVGLPGTEPEVGTAVKNIGAESSKLRVYPNPSADFIQLSMEGALTVYDFTGKKLIENENVTKADKVSVSHLAKGVYFVELNDGNASYASKFVIE